MTSTGRDIVNDSLKLLRVVGEGQTASGNQMKDAMRQLNLMLAGLKPRGADLEYAPISENDEVPLPFEHHEACGYLLAARMAAQYATELIPEVAIEAKRSEEIFQAAYRRNVKLYPDSGLVDRLSPYHGGRYNIFRGP